MNGALYLVESLSLKTERVRVHRKCVIETSESIDCGSLARQQSNEALALLTNLLGFLDRFAVQELPLSHRRVLASLALEFLELLHRASSRACDNRLLDCGRESCNYVRLFSLRNVILNHVDLIDIQIAHDCCHEYGLVFSIIGQRLFCLLLFSYHYEVNIANASLITSLSLAVQEAYALYLKL